MRGTAAVGILAILSFSLAVAHAAPAPPPIVPPPGVHMHRVGYPVEATRTPGALVGSSHVYEVAIGNPPQLVELDPNGTVVARTPLSHGYNAWAVVRGNDGTIYTGVTTNTSTKTGYLYAWKPGAGPARVVATLPDTVTIWSLAVDPATGVVWVGAQGLFSYDPTTGQTQSYGMLGQQEHDIHALAAYGGTVYAGMTPYAEVVQFTPAANSVQVVQDRAGRTSGVDRLAAPDGSTLEILWASGAFEVYKNGSPSRSYYLNDASTASVAAGGQEYTFLGSGGVAQGWDYGYGGNTAASVHPFPTNLGVPPGTRVVAIGDIGGQILGVLDDGGIVSVDPSTWQFALSPVSIPGTPGIIHAMYTDPNGSLWLSVYLGGEVTHVVGRTFTQLPFPFQADSFASYGGVLYIGAYPGAWLYAYNESQPWNFAAGNPKAIGRVQISGPQQDRTFAIAAGPAGVYLGTVPTPGYLDGNLGYYDPGTGQLEVFDSPVPGESITSLVYAPNGMLVGTTTAFGGGNAAPTHQSGRLFVWNPSTNTVSQVYVPQVGAPEWGGLVVGPGRLVYGASPRAVFSFDPTTGHVLVRAFNRSARYDEWSSLTHMATWDGKLFLLTQGHLYQIDPRTLKATPLFYGAEQLAVDGQTLYLSYHGSVALEDLPLRLLTPKNSVYPPGYITYMDRHPNLIP